MRIALGGENVQLVEFFVRRFPPLLLLLQKNNSEYHVRAVGVVSEIGVRGKDLRSSSLALLSEHLYHPNHFLSSSNRIDILTTHTHADFFVGIGMEEST